MKEGQERVILLRPTPETAFQEVVIGPQCPMDFQLPVNVVLIRKKEQKPKHRGFSKK